MSNSIDDWWPGADTLHPKAVDRSREELRIGIQVHSLSQFQTKIWSQNWWLAIVSYKIRSQICDFKMFINSLHTPCCELVCSGSNLHKSTQIQFARNVIFTFCSDEDAHDDGPKGDDWEGTGKTSGSTCFLILLRRCEDNNGEFNEWRHVHQKAPQVIMPL